MARLSQPTHLVVAGRRQAVETTSYLTISASAVYLSVSPTVTELPLDTVNGPDDSAPTSSIDSGDVTSASGIVVSLSTPVPSQSSPTVASALNRGTASKPIPLSAVIAVFIVVPALCAILISFLIWRRKRSRRKVVAARDHDRRYHRDGHSANMGGRRFSKMDESNLEEYKEEAFPHIPGSLPSPATAKHTIPEKPEQYLLSQLSRQAAQPTAVQDRPAKPRRISVKSTVTGKINPSNNFAASHDESHDETWEFGDDALSSRSRAPLSPTSPTSSRGHMHHTFSGLGALSSGTAGLTGEPGSFLTFRSGDGDFEEPQLRTKSSKHTILSDSSLKAGPSVQSTPVPKRALTHRSLKGGVPAPSREGKQDVPRMKKHNDALDNIIAALDHNEERRHSNVPFSDEPHEFDSVMATDEGPLNNPFRDTP